MAYRVRSYQEADRAALKDITRAAFHDASLDRLCEDRWGQLGGTPWWQRKQGAIDADCNAYPLGIFVAETEAGEVVGYITSRLWPEVATGWIANLAVHPDHQRQGLARRLMQAALDHFREQGMTHARIETLASNEAGRHLYPAMGFEELAQQIHYTMDLGTPRA